MRNFDVYFEIFGKKMKTRVMAESQEKAIAAVKDKMVIHKIVKPKEEFNEAMDLLDNLLDILK